MSNHASYTIKAEEAPGEPAQDFSERPAITVVKAFMIASGAAIVVLAIVIWFVTAALVHANNVNDGQDAQIRGLDQSNVRMSTALSQMNDALNGQDPAADMNLLTCADLRHLGLTVTTGGSVSAVPGTVNLSQSPVRLPTHCPKR